MSTPEPEPGCNGRTGAADGTPVDEHIEDCGASEDVEANNVIDQAEDPNGSSSTDPEQPTTCPPLTMAIPLSDLTFHSPSSQIIGTPFTTESRFEYPFPDSSSNVPSPASSTILTSYFPSLSASASFPTSSSSHSLSLSPSPPSTITTFPPTFPLPADLPAYSLKHPKMRPATPPVPPGLVKKRQRWSLGLLRRRSGSNSSQGSPSSESNTRTAPPPASPTTAAAASGAARQTRVSCDPRSRQTTLVEDGVDAPTPPLPHIDAQR